MSKLNNINISPSFSTNIPSTGQSVKFRPYSVKEEKALLAADSSEDGIVMINTLLQVVKNCLTPVPERLTSFDLEFLFAQIRAKSVGEIANIRVGCDAPGCENVQMEYKYDIRDIKVVFPQNKLDTIRINENLAIKMTYPSVEQAIEIEKAPDETDQRYLAIVSSIEQIFNGDEVIDVQTESRRDILNFVDRLPALEYKKLETFFDEIPFVEGTLKYRCPNCRKEHNKKIVGLNSFFS